MILDSKGTIEEIYNPVAPYTVEQVRGLNMYDFISPTEERKRIQGIVKSVFETGMTKTYVTSSVIPEKGEQWFVATISPIRDFDNKIVRVLEVSMNITESKEMEIKLRAKNEELEMLAEVMVDRELKMKELEAELKRLKAVKKGEEK